MDPLSLPAPGSILSPSSNPPVNHPEHDSHSDDDGEITIHEVTEERISVAWEKILVGFIIEGRPYRKQAVTDALIAAWNPRNKVEIRPLEAQKFLFQFHHRMDLENVIMEGPWAVSGNLLLLERWNPSQNWEFRLCEFWIQMHGIPIELREETILVKIARKGGEVNRILWIEGFQFGEKVCYARARVRVDVTKSLRASITIKRVKGCNSVVTLRYKKLPLVAIFVV
ncbi:uncharacterized protein LOC122644788 [Telopea speciosissima]|uniref:uncharacterized protein LOC122644788 n=1 Tax=Telopea speciosissima TaxID=54955 RepID=UPI001CC51268|nr:uncharacterized protein LOC122644788 [Telopea speciosissima]